MPTVANTINIAKVSQFLAARQVQKGGLFSPIPDPLLPIKIYTERKSLEWMYDLDSDHDGIQAVSDYVYSLCGRSGLRATAIINANPGNVPGQGAASTVKSPIYVSASDFADATNWNGQNSDNINILSTYTLQVFWNDVNRFLIQGSEWSRTASGVQILISGFDATTTNSTAVFYIYISV